MAPVARRIRSVALLLSLVLGLSFPGTWAASPAAAETDPLLATWTHEGTGLVLALQADGTFWASLSDREAMGYYGAAEGVLYLTTADDLITEVPYAVDGRTLTLLFKGQTPLTLTAEEQVPATSPTEPGVPPQEADGPAIAYAYADRAVVTVELEAGTTATEYCFTCFDTPPTPDSWDWLPVEGDPFRAFKYDGDYYVFVRDDQGRVSEPYSVTVESGYIYPIHGGGLTSLRQRLSDVLEAAGTSVQALNEAVAEDIARAGVYTRMGAATSAVSAVTQMAKLGYTIPYQGEGSYQGRDDWGFNPNWGAKLRKPTSDGNGTYWYTGMQCVGSIVWALKQAGLEISNGATGWRIGRLGEVKKNGDNKIKYYQARTGDFIQVNSHYEMVMDRVDTDGDGVSDTYLLYEMEAPHLTFLLLSFEVVRFREFFNMDALYGDTGRLSGRNRNWQGSYHIPREDFPAWLTAALEHADEDRAVDRLARSLGLAGASEHISLGR